MKTPSFLKILGSYLSLSPIVGPAPEINAPSEPEPDHPHLGADQVLLEQALLLSIKNDAQDWFLLSVKKPEDVRGFTITANNRKRSVTVAFAVDRYGRQRAFSHSLTYSKQFAKDWGQIVTALLEKREAEIRVYNAKTALQSITSAMR